MKKSIKEILERKNYNTMPSLEDMPSYLSTDHLILLGLYTSHDAAYQARRHGNSPRYMKMGQKILYKKEDVEQFIKSFGED